VLNETKWFSKYICKLAMGINTTQFYNHLLLLFSLFLSQSVALDVEMFSALVGVSAGANPGAVWQTPSHWVRQTPSYCQPMALRGAKCHCEQAARALRRGANLEAFAQKA
jgi:hypothetical protein